MLVEREEADHEMTIPAGADGKQTAIAASATQGHSPRPPAAKWGQVRKRKQPQPAGHGTYNDWSASRATLAKNRVTLGPSSPRPPSPRVIVITSDSDSDNHELSPVPSGRRTTIVAQAETTPKHPSAPTRKHHLRGNAPRPKREQVSQQVAMQFFDSDLEDVPMIASSSSTPIGPRTARSDGNATDDHRRPGSFGIISETPLTASSEMNPVPVASHRSRHRGTVVEQTPSAGPIVPELRSKATPLRLGAKCNALPSYPPSAAAESREPPVLEAVCGAIPTTLLPLLHECGQDKPYSFNSFLEVFRSDVLHAHTKSPVLAYRKLGEASFSEVYAIGDVVLKVVPLRDEERQMSRDGGDTEERGVPEESSVQDVVREICITREMGALCAGFVQLLNAFVVCGSYPKQLLDSWDEYNEEHESESIRPDGFPALQPYGVLVLPNLGTDLEKFSFRPRTGWSQASTIFWQIAQALGAAEQSAQFEHRDLHWGQVLVREDGAGVNATIIDFGLSRMQIGRGNAPLWAPIEDEILLGTGDYQFDIYRMMHSHTAGKWEAFHPLTNIMWMHYLAAKLTQDKGLQAPSSRVERRCAEGLFTAEKLLASSIETAPKNRKVTGQRSDLFRCAADLVRWAEEHGWMETVT